MKWWGVVVAGHGHGGLLFAKKQFLKIVIVETAFYGASGFSRLRSSIDRTRRGRVKEE